MTRDIAARARVLWVPKRNLDWGPPRAQIPEHWWSQPGASLGAPGGRVWL